MTPRNKQDIADSPPFGLLTAKWDTGRRDKSGKAFWHCTCQCGATTTVRVDNLIIGNTTSCGCLRRRKRKAPPAEPGIRVCRVLGGRHYT